MHDDALGPLAGLDDLTRLDAFESLALAKAAPLDPAPQRCGELLARAMKRARHGDHAELCLQAMRAVVQAAQEAALEAAPEFVPGFEPTDLEVYLRRDEARPEWVWGAASLKSSCSLSSSRYCDDFFCHEADVEAAAARACAKLMLQSHDEFEHFTDASFLSEAESAKHRALMEAFALRGEQGRVLREAFEDKGRVGEREDLAFWLQERVAEAAAEGLLPACFENSSLRLWNGFRGEPLLISRWDLLAPGQAPSLFSQDRRGDALQALPSRWGFDPEPAWILPPIDQGREAIWGALCQSLASAASSDWGAISRHEVDDFQSRLGAALDAREIREHASPGHNAPKARL